MTKEQLAEKLNGREIGKENTKAEEVEAIASGPALNFQNVTEETLIVSKTSRNASD